MFITLEGIDGSGKTTAMNYIREYFESKNKKVFTTREPGGCFISEKIREIILEANFSEMDSWTEALLYIAARKEHVEKIIKPSLEEGYIVISDRFTDSTIAYQGGGRSLGFENIQNVQKIVLEDFKPDLTILFDLEIKTANQRINLRDEKNKFDLAEDDFKLKIQESYNKLHSQEPERIKKINSNLTVEEIQESLKTILDRLVF